MKAKIHPKLYDVVFIDLSTGSEFLCTSTKKSDETKKIGGKEYYVVKVESSSASHPFYTGKQKGARVGGQVEKFMAKVKKAQQAKEKKVKEAKEADLEDV